MARFRGELKELPSSCGGSLAVSLTVSKSASSRRHSENHASAGGSEPITHTVRNTHVKVLACVLQSLNSPKSELSLLSKNNLLPTRCTMMSQELTERVQHIRVARMASVANTFP